MADDTLKLPSVDEIARLPRWAQVAFAARCARRVRPLIAAGWPTAPQIHLDAIDRAMTLAEASAAAPAGATEHVVAAVRTAATARADAARDAAIARADAARDAARDASRAAAVAAAAAPDAARAAAAAAAAARDASRAAAVADAAFATLADAAFAAALALAAARAEIRRDFDLLVHIARPVAEGGLGLTSDDDAFPPELFGPMWPEGVPEGWPEGGADVPSGDAVIEVSIEVPNDADDATIEAMVLEMTDRLDDMHRAEGGRGIVIDAVEIPRAAGVPQGVCL